MPTKKLSATALGALADEFWAIKTERLAADKVAKELKVKESLLDSQIIEQMLLSKVSSIGGKSVILVLPAPTMEPAVQDWPKFWEYIKSMDDTSLFEHRPGRAAIKERWANGEVIPGVAQFTVYRLSKQGVK